MDITALSTGLTTANLQNSVSVAMLSKSLHTSEALGEGMIDMMNASAMEQSVHPHIGGNIDISI
ncbi:MAG: YjfB family protein [Lachnospiraceae bacterium]|nr:YjfB family protein [Lachnospiraceae bacterium]